MAMFNLTHNLVKPKMSSENPFGSAQRVKRQKQRMIRTNIKIINEFLRERKKEQNNITTALARLKEKRKSKLISKSDYLRLRKVLLISHEIKKIEMWYLLIKKSTKKYVSTNNN